MNTFLPTDYKVPVSTGNYMKLEDGENTFRIISSAIIGYEYWTENNKPVRLKSYPDRIPVDIRLDDEGKPTKIKHFWAFIVWNYSAKKIQVLELTQKGIMASIKALVDNDKWGDPKRYDITVTKTGEGLSTEYSTMPNPHTELDGEVKQLVLNTNYELNNLFKGGDPFDVKTSDGSSMPSF